MKKYNIYILIVMCFCFSCQDHTDDEQKKRNLISKKELVEVLKQIHIEEAKSELQGVDNIDSLDFYKKHVDIYIDKFSEEDFRKSIDYYSENLEDLEGIYTEVVNGLISNKDSIYSSSLSEINQSQ